MTTCLGLQHFPLGTSQPFPFYLGGNPSLNRTIWCTQVSQTFPGNTKQCRRGAFDAEGTWKCFSLRDWWSVIKCKIRSSSGTRSRSCSTSEWDFFGHKGETFCIWEQIFNGSPCFKVCFLCYSQLNNKEDTLVTCGNISRTCWWTLSINRCLYSGGEKTSISGFIWHLKWIRFIRNFVQERPR